MKMLRTAATALLLLPLLAACDTGEAEEAAGIQTTAVERGDLRITAEATGTVEPIRKVEVKSKASGEILELFADVGDEVEPGTLLARIDPRDVRNRYDQAVADLEVAQTRADIASQQAGRSQELHEAGVITDQELENARLEHSNAQANLIKARTNQDLAELQLSDVTIMAPMRGTILEKHVEQGQVIQSASGNVSGGSTLFIMATLGEMQVRTLVDETDMGEIRAGMPAQVTVEAYPDRLFQGTVTKVEPQAVVQQNVTMFPVIVHLDNSAGLLRPGMNAEVEILIDRAQDVLLVPNNAVVMPQDALPAAMALGLDTESMDMSAFRGGMRGTRPSAGAGGADEGGAGAAGQGTGEAAAPAGTVAGGERFAALRDSLQRRVESGELSRDSVRAIVQARMAGAAAAAGDAGGWRAERGAAFGPGTAADGSRQTRRAVVFVMDGDSLPEPRMVEIGLNDWDYTQVVSGLQEGDVLAIVGAAQLQAQQAEFMNRIRSRQGGGPFGR